VDAGGTVGDAATVVGVATGGWLCVPVEAGGTTVAGGGVGALVVAAGCVAGALGVGVAVAPWQAEITRTAVAPYTRERAHRPWNLTIGFPPPTTRA
jgi:hypothetical protein